MNYYKNSFLSATAFFILLAGLLFTASGCTGPTAENSGETALSSGTVPVEKELLQADDALHVRLQAVQEADNQYVQLLSGPASPATLDEKSGLVIQAEMALQQTIDSLEQRTIKNDETSNQHLAQIILYFKTALQNRRAVSDMRMIVSADSDDSTTMQKTLLSLRSDVQEKNQRITALERANKTKSKSVAPAGTIENTQNYTYAPAKGESLAELKQRNKNLALALNNIQVKYFVIGRDYLVLKKEHDRTVNELAALRKSGNQK